MTLLQNIVFIPKLSIIVIFLSKCTYCIEIARTAIKSFHCFVPFVIILVFCISHSNDVQQISRFISEII